ncbi:e1-E2 ATPase domain-containing protein [Hirsutella rhossiliensis]|uniref:E1-E2 ATPase domain-containing protein n=1 Tax=Hirsutella rhossiliensis TaxID=111463 RepID=A0A9P8SL00_9HYPO|nr:e1-E2 ATPase domain-containing protein [Hirsutella rhossiliensis]KAH0966436.1 e1-E2 ATPase domain-containing protein [Hirsutella rhossiliensis]
MDDGPSTRGVDDQDEADGEDCCGGTKSRDHADDETDGCCQGTDGENQCGRVPDAKPADGCCDDSPTKVSFKTDSDAPDCCRGKSSPCCDDSCLERLALRECKTRLTTSCVDKEDKGKFDRSYPSSPHGLTIACIESCLQPRATCSETACDGHRKSTRERYGATLEALGCICRALLALGQDSCCEARKRPSGEARSASQRSSTRSLARSSEDSCCASGRAGTSRVRARKGAGLCGDRESASAACTGATSLCKTGKSATIQQKDTRPRSATGDPENQAIGEEHVVLCISGMTCTGCETKLNRTLATVSGVRNLKTSLVLSRAEFDVDLCFVTANDVVKHLERTTEFKCERIATRGSSLDMLVAGDASSFINQAWPEGVIDISRVDKNIVRVTFDPAVIGARQLLTAPWDQGVSLAPVHGDPSLEAGSKHVRHVGSMTILSSLLTVPVLVMAWAPLPEREIAYSSASLALATGVQVFVAGPFYPKALKALVFSRVVEMDLLIVLSTSAAYIFSVVSFGYLVAGKPLSTGQFFETSTLLVTLIMVGRYIAALARQKAVESISIRSLQAQSALLINDADTAGERQIDARLLQFGDLFKVLPDSRIPTDGTVVTGSSEVDESLITGEHRPVEKHAKSPVIAGTINGSGMLVIRATRLPGDNTIDTIAAMVDEAKLSKPRMQQLADQVASLFVPVVVALAIVTFVTWVSIGVTSGGKTGSEATIQAITYAITVLIVSCPCAIGLAVPMVVVIASGIAAERGIIFKAAEAIELTYKASHVIFDKTGTLTQGKLSVTAEHHPGDDQASLPLLLGLVAHSRHPVSEAVAGHLRSKGVVAPSSPEVKSLAGRGLEAKVGGQTLRAGNSRWVGVSSHAAVGQMLAQGYTVFCFTIDSDLAAIYGLEDSLRADAAEAVETLQSRGIAVHLVSGDDDGAVQRVATKLGIPAERVRARSSPGDKQVYVKALLDDSADSPPKTRQRRVVVFCGDGTNDAVALAQATVGVHVNRGGGSDVAQCAADVLLLRRDPLRGLVAAMGLSRRAVARIRFNFAWSFVYNALAVLLAAGALVRARVPPQYAGLGELVSVLPVVAAAVLLRWPRTRTV